MKKKHIHYSEDEVELMLEEYYNFYFAVNWRFKPKTVKKKFLFWEWEGPSREKWQTIQRYRFPKVSLRYGGDPYDEDIWKVWLTFVGDDKSMEEFSKTVHGINTYADLDRAFSITKSIEQWEKDKKDYDALLEKYNARLKEGI